MSRSPASAAPSFVPVAASATSATAATAPTATAAAATVATVATTTTAATPASATKETSAANEPLSGASIRVVANRTGIAADTLRVWERRYGFPMPSRRAGGSRVYSESEVARLHLIARAIAAGFRPSEVVTLAPPEITKLVEASAADGAPAPARGTPSRGRDVGGAALVGRPAGDGGAASATAAGAASGAAPGIDAIVTALKADDLTTVRALLRAAAVSLGPRAFVTALAHPLAVRVGELWASGSLDVRHEHLASACLTAQLHLLLGALADGERAPTVLLATLPGETHLLGIDMVSVYLAANLAAPRVLGADTPPSQIADAARALRVDAVGLSISPAANAAETERGARWLAESLPPGVDLWLGGAGARAIAPRVPSAVLAATWAEIDAVLVAVRARLRVP